MRKLLILHNRPCEYSNLIWRVAIKNGWKTFRAVASDNLKEICQGYDLVRYYGNTLHAEYLNGVPFEFYKIPSDFIESVDRWKGTYTGRKVYSMPLGQLSRPLQKDMFVKPAYQKYFEARVYKAGEIVGNDSCKSDDQIYAQEIINPIDEIRCFVFNGEIKTASYYRQNKEFSPEHMEEIPSRVKTMAKDICSFLNITYGLVLDFALLDSGKWVFLEVNEAWASGLYDCDPNKCFDVIINSQFSTNAIS